MLSVPVELALAIAGAFLVSCLADALGWWD